MEAGNRAQFVRFLMFVRFSMLLFAPASFRVGLCIPDARKSKWVQHVFQIRPNLLQQFHVLFSSMFKHVPNHFHFPIGCSIWFIVFVMTFPGQVRPNQIKYRTFSKQNQVFPTTGHGVVSFFKRLKPTRHP